MIGLVSCDKCATVFDVSKLNFPEDIYTEEHDVDPKLGAWDQKEQSWTTSPKMYAHLYIDDAALGCPLIDSGLEGERPYVDWVIVDQYLISMGMY